MVLYLRLINLEAEKQICQAIIAVLKYAGFTFTHSYCGDETFFMAGVPAINSTSHN